VASKKEEAFLLYMIALESLILGASASSEITFQLKLKTAHLIVKVSDKRKDLMRRLARLYGIRSTIVHSGSFQVTDAELEEIGLITKKALLTVVLHKPFKSMVSKKQFDEWLEERLLT
jgi:hypothetical protein